MPKNGVHRHFQAKCAKYSNSCIIKTTNKISKKVCIVITTIKFSLSVVPKFAHKSKMADGRHLQTSISANADGPRDAT